MPVITLRYLGACLLLCAAIGCASTGPRLTAHPWRGTDEALLIMAQRADTIKTLSAECTLTLKRSGETVRLDGAIVAQPPNQMRLRAWKFGHAVMDLTVRPDGIWIWMNEEASIDAETLLPGGGLDSQAGTWPMLDPDLFRDAGLVVDDDGGPEFLIRQPLGDASGWQLETRVQRATLAVLEYRIIDPDHQVTQRMKLSQYRQFGAAIWPMRIEMISDRVSIQIRLRDLELNNPLHPAVFDPPARAQQLKQR